MKYWILSLACTGFLFVACNEAPAPPATPENFEDLEEEGPGKDSLKNIYLSELYFAAPGTNVDSIRYENWKKAYAQKQVLHQEAGARSVAETFANGLIEGIWHERGPNNEAGDMRVIDFDPTSQNFYALSTVGHLWKGNLDGLK